MGSTYVFMSLVWPEYSRTLFIILCHFIWDLLRHIIWYCQAIYLQFHIVQYHFKVICYVTPHVIWHVTSWLWYDLRKSVHFAIEARISRILILVQRLKSYHITCKSFATTATYQTSSYEVITSWAWSSYIISYHIISYHIISYRMILNGYVISHVILPEQSSTFRCTDSSPWPCTNRCIVSRLDTINHLHLTHPTFILVCYSSPLPIQPFCTFNRREVRHLTNWSLCPV